MDALLWEIADKSKFFIMDGGEDPEYQQVYGDRGNGKGNANNVHLVYGKKRKHPGGCKV